MPRPDDITKEEAKLAKELTKRLAENGYEIDFADHPVFDVYTLPRFLRARDHDLDKAYEMFENHLKWREENDVDNIMERCPKENPCYELLQDYWPGRYVGEDKDGVPVWVERGGQMDAQGLMKYVSLENILNYQTYTQEVTMKMKKDLTAKLGKNCYDGVVIEDMKGFGKGHVNSSTIDFFKGINAINADNYPETLKRFYCINAPMYLSIAYKLVKGFIDPVTAKKIQIVGGSYLDTLRELIDDDNISVDYGGNLDVHLSGGGTFSGRNSMGCTYSPFEDDIAARDTKSLEVAVGDGEVGSKVAYEFTSNKDIKFGVTFKSDGGDESELVGLASVNSHKSAETGEFEVEAAGVFTFTFDNSDSWMRGKSVTYHITLTGGAEKKKKKKSKNKSDKKKKSKKGD